jgi:mono/diheme cytochrome c family protein
MKKSNLTVLISMLICLSVQQISGQAWEVPASQKSVKNPSPLNNANVKAGKELFMINCKSCHGEPGKNNGLPLVPPPPDMASEKMQANTDADIFYKITTGRGAMPSFAAVLTPEQRWKIINFIKSFDPKNKGKLVLEPPVKAKLKADADVARSVIAISAQSQDKTGIWGLLPDAEVTVKAKRTFGYMEIGRATTNPAGIAEFQFPKDFKAGREGLVDLTVSLGDDFSSDVVELKQVKLGTAVEPENLFSRRVLWSTNPRTQLWLIFTYLGVVGGVWLTILYIVFLISRIYKAGKD